MADLDVETDDEVERAGEGSPSAFKSTTIGVNAPPLGTVPEGKKATFDEIDMAALLTMLEDKDMECIWWHT